MSDRDFVDEFRNCPPAKGRTEISIDQWLAERRRVTMEVVDTKFVPDDQHGTWDDELQGVRFSGELAVKVRLTPPE